MKLQWIMSWNSYIDSVIAYSRDASGNAHVDKVCIIGMKGGMLSFVLLLST